MVRCFKSLFAWRVVMDCGVNVYLENQVTRRRRVFRRGRLQGRRLDVYQPVASEWLAGGEFYRAPESVSIGGSAATEPAKP